MMLHRSLAAGFLLACAASTGAGELTPGERNGKRIYLRGSNAAGQEVAAYLGDETMDVPGALMACSNCHGRDGRGNPEGGVVPSDITWSRLTKPYGVTHPSGRRHPAYTEASLERAIVAGLDSAGNKLNPAMPRYRMAREDLAGLIAYLKRLESDRDPGVSDSTITVGTLVPTSGRLAEIGAAIRAVLGAYFADLNERGGVYSRRIDLRVAECGRTAFETADAVRRFVATEGIFAMVGAFTAGADTELGSLLEEKEVPLVGPSTLYPVAGFPPNRQIFYLFSGVREEARALANFARLRLPADSPVAVLSPDVPPAAELADAVEAECRKLGWSRISKVSYARAGFQAGPLVDRMSQAGANVVIFLGSGSEHVVLAETAAKSGWRPALLVPGSLVGRDVLATPAGFGGRVYVSFPVQPSDQAPAAAAEYHGFARKHKLPATHLAVSTSAYSAAKVFIEGLKKAGRDLSREKLIGALEGMYKYATGLGPPLTFGPNRRIGALGAHVVEFQPGTGALGPAAEWIELP